MRESVAFLDILDEGREIKAKEIITRLGRKRLGVEDEAERTRLDSIHDQERLDRIVDRLFESPPSTWKDLLDTP